MTLLILSFLSKKRLSLLKSKLVHFFLILVAMLISSSASPQVSADFTTISANTGCGSLVVEFQDLSTGSPDAWLWDFGNGNSSSLKNPTAIYANSGVYDVTLLVSNSGSNDTKTLTGLIKVYENPVAELTTITPTNGCMPLIVSFEDLSFTNNSIANWQWDFGDGGASNLQNPNYEYNTNGEFSVSLIITDANGCQSLSTEVNLIDVYKVPTAGFIADIPFSCNLNELVSFTNNTLGSATYTWDFGDGAISTLTNPTHTYSSGIYDVTLCAKIGTCIDTLVLNNYIEVGAELNSDMTVDVNNGCENLLVNFTDITANFPDSWLWDFGDGTTSALQNPSHNYLNSGTYDVTLTTSKGGQCIDSRTFFGLIEIYEKPIIQIVADTTYGCTIPFNVEFTDVTTNAVSWDWDFGNGTNSNLATPSVLYTNYGSYDVSLTVTNTKGCTQTKDYGSFIDVEKISIDISASAMSGCIPFDVDLIDSTNSIRPLIDWSWSFGDGNFANIQNPSHQYTAAGLFDVSLFVMNDYGCVANADFINYIMVDKAPQVNFEASPLISCAGENIVFTDMSTTGSIITDWEWSFGDGSISNLQNPIHQYQLIGTYDVTLIAGANSCKDTFTLIDYIKILEPSAIFIEEYNCDNPLTVEFENLSIGADNVFWDFGDGTTSNVLNPVHTYLVKGDYFVTLIVDNAITGCTHELVKQIKLTIPKADFDYLVNSTNSLKDSVGCVPHDIYLKNLAQDWEWYKVIWSDGYVGYGRVDHLFVTDGVFDVTMIVTDMHGCKDTMTRTNMYRVADVEADFGITNVLGCDSMLVEFEDLSAPASLVKWEFGDGGGSTMNNPQHIYYAEGFYDVTLYAESFDGCRDTLERLEYIQFQYPTADFNTNTQGVCPNDLVQFNNSSEGIGIASQWDFGDGTQSNQINPTHSFIVNGLYDISLLITDSFGCSNNMILPQHIEVLKPAADFITAGVSSNCPPLISNFTNLSTMDVVDWEWVFSDGGNSLVADPSHLFSTSGIFDVSLIVTNQYGCKDTLVQNGLIDVSGPTGSFILSDTLICKGDSVLFNPIVNNTDFYLWDFGNGILSTDSFATQIYTSEGEYLPVLIIEDTSGCQLTINNSDTIRVRSVDVDAGIDFEICEGEQVQLNAIGNATQFTWSPTTALSNPNLSNPIASPIIDVMYYIHHFDGMCAATDSLFVRVFNDLPTSSFTTANHCDGDTVQFSASSGLVTPNIAWEWSFGAITQNPLQQLALGINTIELVTINLDNSCSDTLVQQVEIHSLPSANFSATEVCLGSQTNFLNISSSNVVSWEYNMGDGNGISYLENPNYTYLNEGEFYPTLIVTSDKGCTDEQTDKIIVNELPFANFSVVNSCVGEENIFTDASTITNGIISSWEYIFGDSTTNGGLSTEQHEYASSGTYNVTLNIISDKGCEASVVKETNVYDNPEVDFLAEQYCFGTPTSFTNFSNINNGNIVAWEWSFGDGLGIIGIEHPTYMFNSSGIFSVNLNATSNFGCTSNLSKTITLHALPIANFTSDKTACLGNDISFTDLSTSASTAIENWEWNFGNGTILNDQNPTYEYGYAQTFNVTLLVVSAAGCKHDTTIINAVEIFDNPIADFSASSLTATELSSEIEFYNESNGAVFYTWDFDNGIISTEENPTFDFEEVGSYEVILQVVSEKGCEDEMMKNINIFPEYALYAPNAFTPNGDGNNDVFLAVGGGVTSFEMQVFDRWGGLVFESSDIEYGWDGLDISSNKVETGTYIYHIALYDYNGKLWIYNGELNLMR